MGGCVDHILHGPVRADAGIAEVGCRPHSFAGELALRWARRRSRRIVIPDAAEHTRWVGRMRAGAAAGDGVAGDTLTILGDRVVPRAAADVVKEALLDRSLAGWVVVVPLAAPVDIERVLFIAILDNCREHLQRPPL